MFKHKKENMGGVTELFLGQVQLTKHEKNDVHKNINSSDLFFFLYSYVLIN
jgi:hypothetical protein